MTESPSAPITDTPPLATADAVWAASGNTATLALRGHFNAHTLGDIWATARDSQNTWLASASGCASLSIDMAKVDYLDGAGIAFLIDLQLALTEAGGFVQVLCLDPRY